MKLVLLGVLGKPHGLRGELGVKAFNPDSPSWGPGAEVLLVPPRAEGEPDVDVVDVSPDDVHLVTVGGLRQGGKGRHVVRLAEVSGRDQAEPLRGWRVMAPLEALEAPDEDEFFFWEMPGWQVETTTGEPVGRVVAATSTHIDLLEVRPTGGGPTFYVPMIGDVVKAVDRARRVVVIEPLEGLLP